jgi:hypothetical protein
MKFKFYARYFLKSLWLYSPGVITIVLAYFILINLSQGRDVVMQVGESLSSFACLVPAVLLWAFFLWYSSRLLGYEKKFVDPNWPLNFLSTFPRVLAYNAFVSIQAAILSLPTILDWGFWSIIIFICVHNSYYFLLTEVFGTKRKRTPLFITTAIAISYVITLWIIHSDKSLHQHYLPLVVILLVVFQLGSLFFFVRRRVRIDKNAKSSYRKDEIDYVTLFKIRVIKLPIWFKEYEQRTFSIFNLVATAAIVWDITLFNSISVAYHVGPLAVVLLAFGILAGLANIIAHQSMRKGINFFLILLLLAIGIGSLKKVGDPYQVELTQATSPNVYSQRPTLESYLKNWTTVHANAINAVDTFPVYFVLADGGASRSGYWVASVLAAWQDESIKQNDPFSDHLLCLSGASGGSVGNATFYGLLKFPPKNDYLNPAQDFLSQDFLTYSIAHYLGPDLARHFINLPTADRAAAISHTFDYWGEQYLSNAFSQNVDALLDSTGRLPMLFINVTSVQEGTPSIISSIRLNGVSDRLDILSIVDNNKSNLSFSTATMLGARFPYISPAGIIDEHAFVDGGYFDNSGAGMVHEVLQAIKKLTETTKDDTLRSLLQKLKVRIVHITNSPKSEPIKPIHPLANDLAAPLLTVFNTYSSQTEVNDRRLESFLKDYCNCNDSIRQINLYEHAPNETYPMNWVISDYQIEKMNARLERVQAKEIKKLLEYNK